MIDVIYDYKERVNQIEKYLSLLLILENLQELENLVHIKDNKILINEDEEIILESILDQKKSFKIESELIKILKSNTILLFYNLIEGTVSAVLNEYFGIINKESLKYSRYKNEVRKIWIKYKHRSFNTTEKREIDYIINSIEKVFDETVTIEPKKVKDSELGYKEVHNYDAYIAETQSNDISGNLDARKIREVFSLYGLPELNFRCDAMLKIKAKRNSLAHGNETFSKVGSQFTIQELYNMKSEIKIFLDLLLTETQEHIKSKKYLISYKKKWKRIRLGKK